MARYFPLLTIPVITSLLPQYGQICSSQSAYRSCAFFNTARGLCVFIIINQIDKYLKMAFWIVDLVWCASNNLMYLHWLEIGLQMKGYYHNAQSLSLIKTNIIQIPPRKMTLITFKLKHGMDFLKELVQAKIVAEYGRLHKIRLPYSKDVTAVKGCLSATITAQIMKKYGSQRTIKNIHNVNLVVPGPSIKFHAETNSIWIPCLNLHLENTIPYNFTKINQAEVDKEYIFFSCTVPDVPEMMPQQFIGVDRNTTGHIAVTANPDNGKIGKFGKSALHIHKKYRNIRWRLQKQNKFRELKRIKDRESRIVQDLNHKISRKIIDMAKVQNAALVFEDLGGIRKTRKQHRSFKYALHSWSFYQLQQFVEYKAKLLGVPILYVYPAYTSQDCSRCGARGQRTGKDFKCPICGHVDHADVNAAFNIALRQKSMIDCTQKEMCTMGALIPHDAILECPAALKTNII